MYRFPKDVRFRLCSSYLQGIVNEIVLRSPPSKKIQVIFEPGTRKFAYGHPALSSIPANRNRGNEANGFARRAPQTQNLFKDAPQQVQTQINEQEKDLDDISNILSDITSIAETMGSELDRQNEQIDRVTNRVDLANEKLYQTNKRIDRLL